MATIVTDNTVTLPDGSTVETIVYDDGSRSVQFTPGPGTPAANQQALQSRAQAALAANATFLGLASPTNAQTLAQVKTLTKECNALIRLLLGALDDISNT
jgi:hypothetical protein